MRRKPIVRPQPLDRVPNLASPNAQIPPATPMSQGDAIEPFQVGGGMTFYLSGWTAPDSPRAFAVPEFGAYQLVASYFVPMGFAGWVKRVMIAPCVPPAIADPFRGWDGTANLFTAAGNPYNSVQRAAAQAGLWETPLAWEGFFTPTDGPLPPLPRWRWHLTILQGTLEENRRNRPAFDVTDPNSWFLVPDIAVPRWVYPTGFPGRAIPGVIGPQRIQQPPSNPLPLHALIPENSTVCLWADWIQSPMNPMATSQNGPAEIWPGGVLPAAEPSDFPQTVIVPLLPSVGSITGYMQAAGRAASQENARYGWGA